MKKKKIYIRLLLLVVAIYVVFTLVNQQITLNQYSKNAEELTAKIEEEKEYKEDLAKQKDNVTSMDFIEQMAREKFDMYYPNERVYIDRGM